MNTAAIIGGGVIGGGWAARFLLNGWDVRVFDPDPEAERKIGEVLANARASLPQLYDSAMPTEGRLSFHDDMAAAVAGATWVQESVPERLDIKQKTYAAIQAAAPDALIGSSTSGFKPSELQDGAARPERIFVAHPFNPVYLLPLIELVAGDAAGDAVAEAAPILSGLGFKPLTVRKEIDAHIADRFLEAVWREALWLVKDGIATTEEIDDAIRFGFGLRWAQMGLFETYRVAGGEAGMKHFMAQFGPALKWPWTKLMDVPEFTDELVDLIAGQSDAQSGHHSIRELERIRDDNLVGIMRALKDRNWGAGTCFPDPVSDAATPAPDESAAPLALTRGHVLPAWIDYNGHMTEARYLQLCADASDAFLRLIGAGLDYVAAGHSFYTAETHIIHKGELKLGAAYRTETRVLGADPKRLHLLHTVIGPDGPAASAEQMLLHVDTRKGGVVPASGAVAEAISRIAAAHSTLDRPAAVGRHVGQR